MGKVIDMRKKFAWRRLRAMTSRGMLCSPKAIELLEELKKYQHSEGEQERLWNENYIK